MEEVKMQVSHDLMENSSNGTSPDFNHLISTLSKEKLEVLGFDIFERFVDDKDKINNSFKPKV